MVARTLTDAGVRVPPGSRREQVLGVLRAADGAMSVVDVAEATGLHANTARFHLDGLVDDRLAERTAEPRNVPGRPRILYAAAGAAPGPRSYALLAEMLTGLIASLDDAGPAAVDAGKAWGRHLIERSAPSERVDSKESIARLNRLLDAIGFQPEIRTSAKAATIRLRHCPFREVAERHTDVVCAIHLGLMQGALEELQAPVAAASLEPFVEPNLCVARVRPSTSANR
ncbi:MAG TPA: helix-turn-helix domain-containing protein [Mycobacteriales bacterium]|nr:helix-turn-helix domain-containing protein [Mycobacteriales bacterium]